MTTAKVAEPIAVKREWLVRCEDTVSELGVCAISTRGGMITFTDVDEDTLLSLSYEQIREFREALDAAVAQAYVDMADSEE
ncbi:hypothetical protein EV193_10599 [Herbihabitans rhizosphaerae]|uniref:Uncharacterized protein n=1 Tax=Herbihabitans rhizosphaerae TaxID=1872711 RepID=A0A4V2ESH0_9PSEU|nr:hypothetical protein [Herbihabitans rhizosphaerae]RZS37543.1 hypothetical protein EV193_10599 [Herbihabitans rhizosphaerae]